ncbi:MAG TPA: LuxR C-terminal-related transcriptional regulator [Steroidobacteraceae bacterium]|nr:LuxR C-terminal-related transcriptional regulator [Steroidobacteraceae bacterium]
MTETVVDPGLILKITPPKLRRNLLARERLRRLAAEGQDTAVFVVEAPAGYGKTSLLAQWRLDWLQSGAAVAWLSLDAEDSPVTVVSGVVLGLRRSTGKARFGTEALEAVRHGAGPTLALTSLLAEIAESAHSTVLMFDNCERAHDPATLEVFAYILHNLTPNMQVVLGTRPPASIETIDLLGRGGLRQLGAADLRFELAESIEFLTTRLGDRVNADLCAQLHESTDGWPLGLQVAATALEQASDPARTVQALAHSQDHATRRYFDGMLDSLPTAMVDLAVRCSLLDALHPSLCEAVTGDETAGLILQRLLVETPLVSATETGDWLRFHPLAREHLRARADRQLSDAERRELHVRAWGWLQEHGFPARAARHALGAGQQGDALALIARSLNAEFEAGHFGTVAEWLARIAPEEIAKDMQLQVVQLWVQVLSYRAAEAVPVAQRLFQDASVDGWVRAEANLVIGTAHAYADDISGGWRYAQRFPAELAGPRARQIFANVETYFLIFDGATEAARRRQAAVQDRQEFPIVSTFGDWFSGQSYLWEGRPLLVDQLLRPQLVRMEAELGRRGEWSCLLSALLATAHWQMGMHKEAVAGLASRLDIIERVTFPDGIISAFRTLAQIAAAEQDEARAFAYLEALATLGARRSMPRMAIASLAERVRLHSAGGRPQQAMALLDELSAVLQGSRVCERLEPLLRLEEAMARAYVLLVAGDDTGAAAVLATAGELARRLNRGNEAIKVQVFRAMLLDRAGTSPVPLLVESLSRAEAGGLVRAFADTLPDVAAFVRRASASGLAPVSREFIERALAAAATVSIDDAGGPDRMTAPRGGGILTPKEAEVLQLLAGGRPNKVIAAEMGLSADTVKWHVKKLFAKLNAGSREHAVERARMLGLLT